MKSLRFVSTKLATHARFKLRSSAVSKSGFEGSESKSLLSLKCSALVSFFPNITAGRRRDINRDPKKEKHTTRELVERGGSTRRHLLVAS